MPQNARVPGLFITGTGTGVGKTFVAAAIARAAAKCGVRVGVYKPLASGCTMVNGRLESDDARNLWESAGRPGTLEAVAPQRFQLALAPHLAAQHEGRQVDSGLLRRGLAYWQQNSDIIIVEGAGGLFSPAGDDELVADLALDFGLPLIVVSKNVLGAIHHSLCAILAAQAYRGGLAVAGIVLNSPGESAADESLDSNAREIARRSATPVLAEVRPAQVDWAEQIDWLAVAKRAGKNRERTADESHRP